MASYEQCSSIAYEASFAVLIEIYPNCLEYVSFIWISVDCESDFTSSIPNNRTSKWQ